MANELFFWFDDISTYLVESPPIKWVPPRWTWQVLPCHPTLHTHSPGSKYNMTHSTRNEDRQSNHESRKKLLLKMNKNYDATRRTFKFNSLENSCTKVYHIELIDLKSDDAWGDDLTCLRITWPMLRAVDTRVIAVLSPRVFRTNCSARYSWNTRTTL